jgi:hypothetical protein
MLSSSPALAVTAGTGPALVLGETGIFLSGVLRGMTNERGAREACPQDIINYVVKIKM